MIIFFPGDGASNEGAAWHGYPHVCYEGDLTVPVEVAGSPWASDAFRESALAELFLSDDEDLTFSQVFVHSIDLPDHIDAVVLAVFTASTFDGRQHILFGPADSQVLTDRGEELRRS